MDEGLYAISVRISNDLLMSLDSHAWEYAKRKIDEQYFHDVIAPIMGDGKHHVLKTTYLKSEDYVYDVTIFYLKVHHSIAAEQKLIIPVYAEIPVSAVAICSACGNVLRLDKRGGCSACGHPAGDDWNANKPLAAPWAFQ